MGSYSHPDAFRPIDLEVIETFYIMFDNSMRLIRWPRRHKGGVRFGGRPFCGLSRVAPLPL
jgi:hypothetical protein